MKKMMLILGGVILSGVSCNMMQIGNCDVREINISFSMRRVKISLFSFNKILGDIIREISDLKGRFHSKTDMETYFTKVQPLLDNLIKLGNDHGKEMASEIVNLFKNYPALRDEIIYVLGKIAEDQVNKKLINILGNTALDCELRECAAMALAQKKDHNSIEALSQILGTERKEIFDKFGIWVIDIKVEKNYKFTPQEIEEIKKALGQVPRKHLEGVSAIVREYPWEASEAKIIVKEGDKVIEEIVEKEAYPGSYKYLSRTIRINDTLDGTEKLRRMLFHEIGHGVHFHVMDRVKWEEFKKLHSQSKNMDCFVRRYGSTNFYEDFATIYEELVENREYSSNNQTLGKKIAIVLELFPPCGG